MVTYSSKTDMAGYMAMHMLEVIKGILKVLQNFKRGKKLNLSYLVFDSRPKVGTAELLCSRFHPVLGHPVILSIPEDMADMGLSGELTLTPAAALCPCPKVFSNQLNRISSASISF